MDWPLKTRFQVPGSAGKVFKEYGMSSGKAAAASSADHLSADQSWDFARDFQNARNPDGTWCYGFYGNGPAGILAARRTDILPTYQDYVLWETVGKNTGSEPLIWLGGLCCWEPGQAGMDAGADQDTVIRWTSPIDGLVAVSVRFTGQRQPGGTHAAVSVAMNQVKLFSGEVHGYMGCSSSVGDYWDDADRWIRNQFAEGQLTCSDWVYEMAAERPPATTFPRKYLTTDYVPERSLGSFSGWPSANDWIGMEGNAIMHCCTGSGARAIYYAWDSILGFANGRLNINLLLNRASRWADVDSFIPYEGRVDVKIKEPLELQVRLPEWVSPCQVKCQVNGDDRTLTFAGRFAGVGPVEPGDTVMLVFPIFERQDVLQIKGREFTIIRKGNDVVHIDPPGEHEPYYQRDQYRGAKALFKVSERFVADEVVHW
jgi:hypothetical protein